MSDKKLDEAIERAISVATGPEFEFTKDHLRLAAWLTELKAWRARDMTRLGVTQRPGYDAEGMTEENSAKCAECGRRTFHSDFSVLSNTPHYGGRICDFCAKFNYPEKLKAYLGTSERQVEVQMLFDSKKDGFTALPIAAASWITTPGD